MNNDLKKLNGIQLLALRVTRPELGKAIDSELARRSGHNPRVALAIAA